MQLLTVIYNDWKSWLGFLPVYKVYQCQLGFLQNWYYYLATIMQIRISVIIIITSTTKHHYQWSSSSPSSLSPLLSDHYHHYYHHQCHHHLITIITTIPLLSDHHHQCHHQSTITIIAIIITVPLLWSNPPSLYHYYGQIHYHNYCHYHFFYHHQCHHHLITIITTIPLLSDHCHHQCHHHHNYRHHHHCTITIWSLSQSMPPPIHHHNYHHHHHCTAPLLSDHYHHYNITINTTTITITTILTIQIYFSQVCEFTQSSLQKRNKTVLNNPWQEPQHSWQCFNFSAQCQITQNMKMNAPHYTDHFTVASQTMKWYNYLYNN